MPDLRAICPAGLLGSNQLQDGINCRKTKGYGWQQASPWLGVAKWQGAVKQRESSCRPEAALLTPNLGRLTGADFHTGSIMAERALHCCEQ